MEKSKDIDCESYIQDNLERYEDLSIPFTEEDIKHMTMFYYSHKLEKRLPLTKAEQIISTAYKDHKITRDQQAKERRGKLFGAKRPIRRTRIYLNRFIHLYQKFLITDRLLIGYVQGVYREYAANGSCSEQFIRKSLSEMEKDGYIEILREDRSNPHKITAISAKIKNSRIPRYLEEAKEYLNDLNKKNNTK